jgi:hypothetical protein
VATAAAFSDAGGFDNARRFRVLLAREATWDEAKKRRLSYHAQKLLQEPALDGNFLQRPREQRVDVETRRVRRANASNIALPLAEPDRAIAALQELLSIPYAGALAANMPLTPVLLRLDPRFQKLVASPAPKQ